jgi:putative transposase
MIRVCYLALGNITKKWKNPPVTWKLAATQFAIQFGERFFAADVA